MTSVSLDQEKKAFTLHKSQQAFEAAKELMPGGVNSPARASKSVGGQPIVIDSVKGSHMWDIDGNEYIDYVGSWGPAIIGHADDEVKALAETMKKGTSFGALLFFGRATTPAHVEDSSNKEEIVQPADAIMGSIVGDGGSQQAPLPAIDVKSSLKRRKPLKISMEAKI